MNKEISIIVAGGAATGKSTLMLLIEKLLIENGFDAKISIDGNLDYTGKSELYFRQMHLAHFDEAIDAVKAKTKITVKEMQTNNPYAITQESNKR